jgi:AAA domain
MGCLNGKELNGSSNGTGALTPIPAATTVDTTAATNNGNGSKPLTSTLNPFAKAEKYDAKGRVALIGPAGGGKSFTALVLARALAGPKGKIAAIDTEHGSLSKYADLFDFDVLELDSFSPQSFIETLHAAEQNRYSVFLCDSLSHFWMGKDGALEFVDMAQKRQKDQMGGWKEFRPHERMMVDELISSPCHVICTMRTKTDYQEQTDAQGRKKRVKVGLAPVQGEGLDYEFDLVGYMDEDHTFAVDKTRCPAYSEKAYTKPTAKNFAPFVEWLKGAQRPVKLPPQLDTGGFAPGIEAARYVAQQKIEELKTMGDVKRHFAGLREALGEFDYLGLLSEFGVKRAEEFRDSQTARECAKKMQAKLKAVQ